jgi:hypothetical protein
VPEWAAGVSVIEVKEILRLSLDGRSLRDVSRVVGCGP